MDAQTIEQKRLSKKGNVVVVVGIVVVVAILRYLGLCREANVKYSIFSCLVIWMTI